MRFGGQRLGQFDYRSEQSPPQFGARICACDCGVQRAMDCVVARVEGWAKPGESVRDDVKSAYDAWTASGLRDFFADRLKVQLREQGARHDLVDAVFALEGQDDLLLVVRRVEALGKFLDTEDGKNLLAGTKRAANILRIEEKKDAREYRRQARPLALPPGRGMGAVEGDRRRQGRSLRRRRERRLRRRHDRDGEAAPACRCVLRQGDRQRRRRSRSARTGCACSTKSARRPARSRISRGSKVSSAQRRAGFFRRVNVDCVIRALRCMNPRSADVRF